VSLKLSNEAAVLFALYDLVKGGPFAYAKGPLRRYIYNILW